MPPRTWTWVCGGGVVVNVTRVPPCEVTIVLGPWELTTVTVFPPITDSTFNETGPTSTDGVNTTTLVVGVPPTLTTWV